MTGVRLRRIFWIGAAAILVVAALIGIAAVLRGDFSDNDGRILVTLAAVLYTGGAGLAGLALADRGGRARPLGLIVASTAPVAFALMAWGIWSFVFEEENETPSRTAWSAVLLVLPGLLAATAVLIARSARLVRVALTSGAVAALAALLSVTGIWSHEGSEGFIKLIAVLWILAALTYLLVPVLQRFSAAPTADLPLRVLAVLGDVELVATRGGSGLDVRLAPGERLQLRRRT